MISTKTYSAHEWSIGFILFIKIQYVLVLLLLLLLFWLFKVDCEATHFSVIISSQLTGAHSRKFSSCKAKLSAVKHPSAPQAIFHLQ